MSSVFEALSLKELFLAFFVYSYYVYFYRVLSEPQRALLQNCCKNDLYMR